MTIKHYKIELKTFMLKYQYFSYMLFKPFKDIKQDLQSIKNQILQVTDKIPLEQLTTFSRMLGSIQGGTRDITPMVHMAEKIR